MTVCWLCPISQGNMFQFQALKRGVIHNGEVYGCASQKGDLETPLEAVSNSEPIRILKRMNVPTVLILNIDCLVLMGSIVNFNKINFRLLLRSFIIILHGALGMPLSSVIRCSVCLAQQRSAPLLHPMAWSRTAHVLFRAPPPFGTHQFICFHMYISFSYFLKIIVLCYFPAFPPLAFR